MAYVYYLILVMLRKHHKLRHCPLSRKCLNSATPAHAMHESYACKASKTEDAGKRHHTTKATEIMLGSISGRQQRSCLEVSQEDTLITSSGVARGGTHAWTRPHVLGPRCPQYSSSAEVGPVGGLEACMCSPCSALQPHRLRVACGQSTASQRRAHRAGCGTQTPSCCTCSQR
jgi:hypothetical protein